MKTLQESVLWLGLSAVLTAASGHAGERLVLNGDGRCLERSWVKGRDGATVVVKDGAKSPYKLRYRYVDAYLSSAALTTTDPVLPGSVNGPDLRFELPGDGRHPLAVYEFVQGASDSRGALEEETEEVARKIEAANAVWLKTEEHEQFAAADAEAQAAKAKLEGDQKVLMPQIDALAEAIAAISEEIKAYTGMSTEAAVVRVRALQEESRRVREQQQALTRAIENARRRLAGLLENAELLASSEELKGLRRRQEDLRDRLEQTGCVVKRQGTLFLASAQKPIFYDSSALKGEDHPLTLERLGAFPPLTQDDSLFAVIVNEQLGFKEPYVLSYSVANEPPPNPTLVRPTYKFELQGGQDKSAPPCAPAAFTDVVMPFGRLFPANTVLTVTVASLRKILTSQTTTDKGPAGDVPKTSETQTVHELKPVKVLDGEKYPAIRGLYRFNFATGITVSGLRDPSFVRVQTRLDDPATSPANEATYADQRIEGDRTIKPVVFIAIYPKRIDIQAPITWREALIPAPTIGLAISSSPQDDVFLGFSHEVTRNVQLIYGVHWGKLKEQTPRGVDNPSSSTPPSTFSHYHHAGFVGLSFNLNFVRQIFK